MAARVRAGAPVHAALNASASAAQGGPDAPPAPRPATPNFVAQQALPAGEAYEAHVFRTGDCPTRDNLHDFFNGLVWLQLPLAKRRLNALHQAQISAGAQGAVRGPVRDAITLFDENGALLHAPPALWDALLARQWRRLFVELRPLWAQAHLLVFGHALLEKLVAPRKDLTAHVWRADAPVGPLESLDAWLAQQFEAPRLATKPFTPLPVMGVPGWCADSEDPTWYDDASVFRPARAVPGGVAPAIPSARSDIA